MTSFVVAIVGIILLAGLANNAWTNTNTRTITDAQFTFTNNTGTCTVISSGDCLVSVTKIENATTSDVLASSSYSICYNGGIPNGIRVSALNASWVAMNTQTANITYAQSVDCMYVANSTSRTLIPIVLILFALGLMLGVSYWLFQKGAFDF